MKSSAGGVAAVVVTHNSQATLAACLRTALAQPELVELVVVDNASRPGWQSGLPDDPRLRYLHNAENVGFATACNQGAERCAAPWLLFLNPDCELPREAISELLRVWQRDSNLGVLGAQLINTDGSDQVTSRRGTPTPTAVLNRRFNKVAPPAVDDEVGIEYVDAVSGALMFLPRTEFEAFGGFDTGYRLHCEDLDLCRRVLSSGKRVGLARAVRVLHHKGTSSRDRPIWVEWQKHRGMWRYFNKFDRAVTPAWLSAFLALGLLLRFPLAAARAWWRSTRAA